MSTTLLNEYGMGWYGDLDGPPNKGQGH